jgi:hypothetical protein
LQPHLDLPGACLSSHRVPLALGDHAPGPAFLELSTHPGREHGAVDLRDHVLEADEGLILRLSEAERAEASRTRGVGSQRLDAALM